jgi:hypothetical protein
MTAIYLGLGNFRLRSSLKSLQRKNSGLQEELNSLRNLPITEAEMPASRTAEIVGTDSAEEAEEANTG